MTTNAQIALLAAAVNLPNAPTAEVKDRAQTFMRYLENNEIRNIRE